MALGGGGNVLGLIFKIKADGTKETKEDIRSLRAEFTKEVNDIKSGGTDAFLSIGKAAGLSTSEIANFKIGALAAVGAVTAITSAIVGGTIALFQLTKQASDYGSQIWNAHLKTGLTVPTISALEQAGAQANVTLQQMSTGLIKFTNNLGEADAGNKKMLATMSNVGVKTFKDSEKALSEFLTYFGSLKTEQERVQAASTVFGARMGGTFNQLFEQMGYDIEKFKDELRSQGLLMSEEEARMADAFGDLYTRVSRQLTGLGRQVGMVLMPIFGGFFTLIGNSLKENQGDWQRWGEIISDVVGGVLTVVVALGKFINQSVSSWKGALLGVASIAMPAFGALRFLAPGGFMDQAAQELVQAQEAFKQATGSGSPGDHDFKNLPPKGAKAKKDNSAKQALDAEMSELKDSIRQRESAYSEETARLKSEHDQQLSSFEQLMTAERNAADDRLHDVIASIEAEEKALNDAHAKGIIKEAEYLSKSTGLMKDKTVATNKRLQEESKLEAEEYKHKIDIERRYYDESKALADKQATDRIDDLGKVRDLLLQDADWQIANDQQRIKKQLEIELAYNEQVQQIRLERLDEQERRLTEEVRMIAEHYAEVKGLSIEEAFVSEVVIEAGKERAQKLIALEYERSRITKETTDANIKAYRDEARAMFDAQNAAAQGASRPRRANPLPNEIDQFAKLKEQLHQLYGMKGDAWFDAISTGFNAIADATGNALKNFILMGSAGTSFRKFAAEVIASIAQMAVVKAVWELAEGFAALARAFFGDPKAAAEAHAHFVAAGIYATIAGIAAIAGRVTAGNEFKNDSSAGRSAGAGTGGGTSGSSSDKTKLPDISVGRFQAVPTVVHLDVNVKRDAGSIVDVVTRDYQNNGPLRQLVVKDGVTARG